MLSNPDLIDVLNAYTVPVNVDKNAPRAHSPTERAYCPTIASVGTRLVLPDGRLVTLPDETTGRPEVTAQFIEKVARAAGVQRGASVTHEVHPPDHAESDLVLMQTSRFLESLPDGQPQLPRDPAFHVPMNWDSMLSADKAWELHLHCPTREWTVLTSTQWHALVPRQSHAVGERYEVDPSVATEILYRFRPPTHYSHLDRREVERCRLTGEITAVEGSRLELRFGGYVKVWHRWFPTAGEGVYLGEVERNGHWAESDVAGSGTYDLGTQKFTRLTLVTDDGRYLGHDGTQLAYGTVAQLWSQ